jgi:hypothetical protein
VAGRGSRLPPKGPGCVHAPADSPPFQGADVIRDVEFVVFDEVWVLGRGAGRGRRERGTGRATASSRGLPGRVTGSCVCGWATAAAPLRSQVRFTTLPPHLPIAAGALRERRGPRRGVGGGTKWRGAGGPQQAAGRSFAAAPRELPALLAPGHHHAAPAHHPGHAVSHGAQRHGLRGLGGLKRWPEGAVGKARRAASRQTQRCTHAERVYVALRGRGRAYVRVPQVGRTKRKVIHVTGALRRGQGHTARALVTCAPRSTCPPHWRPAKGLTAIRRQLLPLSRPSQLPLRHARQGPPSGPCLWSTACTMRARRTPYAAGARGAPCRARVVVRWSGARRDTGRTRRPPFKGTSSCRRACAARLGTTRRATRRPRPPLEEAGCVPSRCARGQAAAWSVRSRARYRAILRLSWRLSCGLAASSGRGLGPRRTRRRRARRARAGRAQRGRGRRGPRPAAQRRGRSSADGGGCVAPQRLAGAGVGFRVCSLAVLSLHAHAAVPPRSRRQGRWRRPQ